MVQLPTFYISDCYDDNARARYAARIAEVTPLAGPVQFVGVKSDLEAAGSLVDILDGLEEKEAVIFLNVAPRGTQKTIWPNGTPFGHLEFQNTHIFTTIDGYALSLLNKCVNLSRLQKDYTENNILKVQVFDIPAVVPLLTDNPELRERIIKSQFRSFDFLPRIAGFVLSGKSVPVSVLDNIPKAPSSVWWVDNFGNAKTTILNSELKLTPGQEVALSVPPPSGGRLGGGEDLEKPTPLKYYDRLKDIPFGETATYTGSSGLGPLRFLEITTQKGDDLQTNHHTSALNLQVGDMVNLQMS